MLRERSVGAPMSTCWIRIAACSWSTGARAAYPTPTCCSTASEASDPRFTPYTVTSLSGPSGPRMPVALVLSAGMGTRLRPLSWLRAKPALPVAGAPLIVHILRWLASHGIREAIVNLHHRSETIAAAVGDGAAFDLRVRYSWEQPLLGSGGGPARAFSIVEGDELLIVNGDTLTDIDLGAMYAAHATSDALVTMALIQNPQPLLYGGVQLDSSGAV